MNRPSREDLKRIKRVERGPKDQTYRINIKNIIMVLESEEYVTLLSARGMSRDYLATELKKKVEEIRDTDFYKFVVMLGCDKLMQMAHEGAMKQHMHRAIGRMMQDGMSEDDKRMEREIERELDEEESSKNG